MSSTLKKSPPSTATEAEFAAMREALQATLASHNNKGRAQLCDCSLCQMVRAALKPGAAKDYATRLREQCVEVVEWKISELSKQSTVPSGLTVAREIADLLRVLTLPL